MEFKRFLAFIVDAFMALLLFVPISIILVLLDVEVSATTLPWLVWGGCFVKTVLEEEALESVCWDTEW